MNRKLKALLAVVILLTAYATAYPALRWRSVLVRHEIYSQGFKKGSLVSEVAAGRDSRPGGIGAIKNALAPGASWVYTPLRAVEAYYWNSQDESRD